MESASFCPAKGRFAAGGEDMWVHLYDYATGEELECNKGAGLGAHLLRAVLLLSRLISCRCVLHSSSLQHEQQACMEAVSSTSAW